MSAPMNDIPIVYVNNTGRNDFMVVVFAANEDPDAFETPFVAWHTLKAPGSEAFIYPAATAVGSYQDGAISAGPLAANPGSTWEMKTFPTPTLSEVTSAPTNTIVIRNMTRSDQPFNFGLYKSGKLLMTQMSVMVGAQAVFQLNSKLYFGVVKDIRIGETFKALTTTQSYFMMNLNDFANGLIVNLNINASGEFQFTADHAQ